MNATVVETLERRLDATRRALIGEQERLTTAHDQAAHAAGYVLQVEDGIRKSEQIIADLQEALDGLRGWTPETQDRAPLDWLPVQSALVDPMTVPCPSCHAKAGDPCRTPGGNVLDKPHATRGAPA